MSKKISMEVVRRAFVTAKPDACMDYPSVAQVARGLGVRPAEARRAAEAEGWEFERQVAHARAWVERFGLGARTEEEFLERSLHTALRSHLVAEGPEGARWARADDRRCWRAATRPIFQLEAEQEEKAARKALDEIREFRREAAKRAAA